MPAHIGIAASLENEPHLVARLGLRATADSVMLGGGIVAGFLIAAARWGSYIGIGPAYMTDVMLGGSIAVASARRLILNSGVRRAGGPNLLMVLVGLLLVWSVARALTSFDGTLVWARDLAPYAYACIAFISFTSYRGASASTRNATGRWVLGCLWFHAAWVGVAVLTPSVVAEAPAIPGQTIHWLEVRPDVDGALIGVLAAVGVARLFSERRPILWLVTLPVLVVIEFQLHSRAGLLAALAAVGLALARGLVPDHGSQVRRRLLIACLPVLVVGAVVVGGQTIVGQRLVGTFGDSPFTAAAQSGAGTAQARSVAWDRVLAYVSSSEIVAIFGVGFGPDFLVDSGAATYLEGTDYSGVRSPHNFLIGTYARLGIVGVAIVVTLLGLALLHGIRMSIFEEPDSALTLPVSLLAVVLPIIALLGVVLESPFGAVPFYWSLGVLAAIVQERRLTSAMGRFAPLESREAPGLRPRAAPSLSR